MTRQTSDRETTGGPASGGDPHRLALRDMTAADLPDVLAIERASFSTPWTEATFRGLLGRQDTELVVAAVEGRVVGYAVFWAVLEQGELGDLAVDRTWRRRGVAARLLREILDRATRRGTRELYLEVRASNQEAQRLYDRFEFATVGRRRDYYSSPREDALVLRRRI